MLKGAKRRFQCTFLPLWPSRRKWDHNGSEETLKEKDEWYGCPASRMHRYESSCAIIQGTMPARTKW